MSIEFFGIRHHGPGSARSLLSALKSYAPDLILVEGPPDADAMIEHVTHKKLKPPVALLVYDPNDPSNCAFYPFARFSPEWVAMKFARSGGVAVRFFDLPQTHQLAIRKKKEEELAQAYEEAMSEAESEESEAVPAQTAEEPEEGFSPQELPYMFAGDPLRWLAEAAGYEDSERWWEHLVEERAEAGDVFEAITEAMTALREELEPHEIGFEPEEEAMREAWMRKELRAAQKSGAERIAVVCGAWHVPALKNPPPLKEDTAILKGLPKTKTESTWVPWTYTRLNRESGYGAGIESPGWYHHLWKEQSRAKNPTAEQIATTWMVKTARLLREKDFDVSSANVIETVRLTQSLAALRGRNLPGLMEMADATRTVMLFGDDLPLRFIHEDLIVGKYLGKVPDEIPAVPIKQDLARLQKSLRLKPTSEIKTHAFDLRKPMDLDRSHLLHRLRILRVKWGEINQAGSRSKGTFRETWELQWEPGFEVHLIEAALWGNTVETAANAFIRDQAKEAQQLDKLLKMLDTVLLADLPDATATIMLKLHERSALTNDVGQLMEAMPHLANVLRYGNVRKTDTTILKGLVRDLTARICIGLPSSCMSLDDDAAREMQKKLISVDAALRLIETEELLAEWRDTLEVIAQMEELHAAVEGRARRILFDCGRDSIEQTSNAMALALSVGQSPESAADWLEGFLSGSGLLILHNEALWTLIDEWMSELGAERFQDILPMLRRTFATFPAGERKLMGQRALTGPASGRETKSVNGTTKAIVEIGDELDAQTEKALEVVWTLLGVGDASPGKGKK